MPSSRANNVDTCSISGAGVDGSVTAPAAVIGAGRGEEKESMYGIVVGVRRVRAKKESSVLGLGMREGVGRRVVVGAVRRAAHQGWVRKWVRSLFGEGGIVVVVEGEGEGDGGGEGCWDILRGYCYGRCRVGG